MAEYLAFCGIRCDLCALHVSNFKTIDREKFCWGMKRYFDFEISPNDIKSCKGCLEGGEKDCKIKPCSISKNIKNCSLCSDYPCELMKEQLTRIYSKVKDVSSLTPEDYNMFFRPYESEKNFKAFQQNIR